MRRTFACTGRIASMISRTHVSLIDAVREMATCLPAREVIATLDSLLYLRVMTMGQVRDAFGGLPARCRACSPKSMRARSRARRRSRASCSANWEPGSTYKYGSAVSAGVDFVVEGFLIVECDSKAHHEGWSKQREDRRRDLAAAERGYVTLRLLAEDLLYHPERVREALRSLLAARKVCGGR